MTPTQHRVLVADSDASTRFMLSQALGALGHQVRTTGNAATLLKWVSRGEADLVISDAALPDQNIFEVLPRIRSAAPKLPIILLGREANILNSISAAQAGVFDFIVKSVDSSEVVAAAGRALSRPKHVEIARAQARAARNERLPLIGTSRSMQAVYHRLSKLVASDLTVLITGESGTGKDLVARLLHDVRRQRNGKFVAVNLAAITGDQLERKLFGGPTGAGALAEAEGGTLFLDEVDSMSLDAQLRLLRIFDPGEGAANVRVTAAANRELLGLMRAGAFREDLFFRLNVAPVRLPPLRDRADDLMDLAQAFLLRAEREGLPAKSLDPEAVERLKTYSWPGNVRELENLIRRICALYSDEVITPQIVARELDDLDAREARQEGEELSKFVERKLAAYFAGDPGCCPPPDLYDHLLDQLERPLFRMTLAATRGNHVRAAELLGINRNTLRKKIEDRGVEVLRRTRRRSAA